MPAAGVPKRPDLRGTRTLGAPDGPAVLAVQMQIPTRRAGRAGPAPQPGERRERGIPELVATPLAEAEPRKVPAAPPRLGARPSWERDTARGLGRAGGRRAGQPDSSTIAASGPELSLRAHPVPFLHTEPHCHPEVGAVTSQAGSRGAVTWGHTDSKPRNEAPPSRPLTSRHPELVRRGVTQDSLPGCLPPGEDSKACSFGAAASGSRHHTGQRQGPRDRGGRRMGELEVPRVCVFVVTMYTRM